MGKNIVVLSDGTGNSAGKLFRTNVWRFYQALDLSDSSQVACYDDGVGSSSIKPLAILGGALGWGLKRNVLDLYTFLCRNYKPGDRIYGVGFSRGAFTIRILAQFVLSQNLIKNFTSDDDLWKKSRQLYREFRRIKQPQFGLASPGRTIRDFVFSAFNWILGRSQLADIERTKVATIRFLGLWDTVDAYGIPIFELKSGIDKYIWPLFLKDTKFDRRINKACHALAIDDARTTFHPLLWDERNKKKFPNKKHTDDERLTQVWFAGMHANVGGGYPDDGMSYVSLRWMINEASKKGLVFNDTALDNVEISCAPYGRMYDSRDGFSSYYRYDPRRLDPPRDVQGASIPSPKIHESVIWRMASGTDAYAPLSLPIDFRVVSDANIHPARSRRQPNIHNFGRYIQTEAKRKIAVAQAARRPSRNGRVQNAIAQISQPKGTIVKLIWATVWWRRVIYFLTVFTTTILVLFPFLPASNVIGIPWPWNDFVDHFLEAATPAVASVAGVARGFLPGMLQPWIEAFVNNPWKFTLLGLLVLLFFVLGLMIERRIRDRSLAAWNMGWRRRRYEWLQGSLRWRFRVGAALLLVYSVLIASAAYLVLDSIDQFQKLNGYVPWASVWGGIPGLPESGGAGFVLLRILGIFAEMNRAAGLILLLLSVLIILTPITIIWMIAVRWVQRKSLSEKEEVAGLALWLADGMRNSWIVNVLYRAFTIHILPAAFAFIVVFLAIAVASRVNFAFLSSAGRICQIPNWREGGAPIPDEGLSDSFKAKTGCYHTKHNLRADMRYEIVVHDGFADRKGWRKTWWGRIAIYALVPFRRELTSSWFAPTLRVGDTGDQQYVLRRQRTIIEPKQFGRAFLFVNDAVIGFPWYWDVFYSLNHGEIEFEIKVIGPAKKNN